MTITEMKKMFLELYGGDDSELRVFESPGRVNLIGEHVDYCGGCVMPAALTMKTTIIARKRNDDVIRLKATDLDLLVETTISKMAELKGKIKWGDYQIGVALELLNAGYDICGCDLLYDDTVPHGGGLSSSAAIEVSTALMFATFSNEAKGITKEIDMIEMALLSQKAEHNFIDVKCGIMDQFASAMGKAGHAIYLNCATLEYEHIPLKMDGYKIVLTNTNVKHSLGSSKYNERRMECEEGLSILKGVMPDIAQLSDVTPEEFELHKDLITNPTVQKRIKHVVYECDRVKKSAEALKNNEIEKFGEFMNESHNSLQYDYEVTCPELDFVVQEGRKIDGVLGIRMTGAGFGGCTVAIIRDNAIDNYIETVKASFNKEFGHDASFYVTETGDGGREI
jgi:galactokinase